jgi:hypothetical protein
LHTCGLHIGHNFLISPRSSMQPSSPSPPFPHPPAQQVQSHGNTTTLACRLGKTRQMILSGTRNCNFRSWQHDGHDARSAELNREKMVKKISRLEIAKRFACSVSLGVHCSCVSIATSGSERRETRKMAAECSSTQETDNRAG